MDGRHLFPKSFRGSKNDGFTLIEALVAFVVLALVTVVLQRGVVESRAGLARVSEKVDADAVLRTLMTGPLGADALLIGKTSGSLDGYEWTMMIGPLDLPPPDTKQVFDATIWVPVRVKLWISRNNTQRSVEIVRIVRSAS